ELPQLAEMRELLRDRSLVVGLDPATRKVEKLVDAVVSAEPHRDQILPAEFRLGPGSGGGGGIRRGAPRRAAEALRDAFDDLGGVCHDVPGGRGAWSAHRRSPSSNQMIQGTCNTE